MIAQNRKRWISTDIVVVTRRVIFYAEMKKTVIAVYKETDRTQCWKWVIVVTYAKCCELLSFIAWFQKNCNIMNWELLQKFAVIWTFVFLSPADSAPVAENVV